MKKVLDSLEDDFNTPLFRANLLFEIKAENRAKIDPSSSQQSVTRSNSFF